MSTRASKLRSTTQNSGMKGTSAKKDKLLDLGKRQENSYVKVAIRCRPLSEKEIADGHQSIVEFEAGAKVIVHNVNESPSDQLGTKSGERFNLSHVFEFDSVFDCQASQEEVYERACRPIVDSVLEGYNGTIFAYGQTGTGKTHTMEGSAGYQNSSRRGSKQLSTRKNSSGTTSDGRRLSSESTKSGSLASSERRKSSTGQQQDQQPAKQSPGIIPRTFDHIFDHINKNPAIQFLIRASYLEIYQEKIHDLLRKDKSVKLELHERPDTGVYVKDLTSFVCKSIVEIERVMRVGNQNRRVGATDMNEHSSRSHAIFMITVEQQQQIELKADGYNRHSASASAKAGESKKSRVIKVGKLNLVDLAGSERQRKTNSSGQRQKESIKINLSLSALGNVINSLTKVQQQKLGNNINSDVNVSNNNFTPYRDSKLTRLLQDSLGGNAKTLMIANIGPANYNYDETINTLQYASRAKCIKNRPRLNEDPKDALLRELQREIDNLRSKLASLGHKPKATSSGGEVESDDMLSADIKRRNNKADNQRVELELAELRQKLSSLEGKLLNGEKFNGIDQKILQGYTENQALELKRHQEELANHASRERAIRDELEAREAAELLAQESFNSIQQELDTKRQLIRQVLVKIKALHDETKQIQETYRLELEELDQLQYVLQKELKLKCLIMDNFLPNIHVDQLLPRIVYDERRNSCSVLPIDLPLDYCAIQHRDNLSFGEDPNSIGKFEDYWEPTDGIAIWPRSESERIGETIYPGDIRYKYENLIEPQLELPEKYPKRVLDVDDNSNEQAKNMPVEVSRIQSLIDSALNQREPDIVIY